MIHIKILQSLCDLPFSVGKKLLKSYLVGDEFNPSIEKNRLNDLDSFGSCQDSDDQTLEENIHNLIQKKMISLESFNNQKFWKVMKITQKGKEEIKNPTLTPKKTKVIETNISPEEEQLFKSLDFYLNPYNNFQKKGIISQKKEILCIAGAGTGKTTVLTKRIEFLTKFRSISPKKILAITFTRKARQEMISRLKDSPSTLGVQIETFNSFCEKFLQRYQDKIYNKPTTVVSFRQKIRLLSVALDKLGISMERALSIYFTDRQRKDKSADQLSFTLLNDCFTILDFSKMENKEIEICDKSCTISEQHTAKMIINICKHIDKMMKAEGLRDYTDQIIDTLKFFKSNSNYIPEFEHILVDEFQDINSSQIELIDILKPKNIFCVGDPRQSIFGWRGSKIKYINDFQEKYPEAQLISLITNYRSSPHIVNLINKSIKLMNLPDLEANKKDEEKKISIYKAKNEMDEYAVVLKKIQESKHPKEQIFVLSRINRKLKELSDHLKVKKIPHVVRTDEQKRMRLANKGEVTLATIHAIKGLEAKSVIIMGCNMNSFPCKTSDHPIIDILKTEEYDKDDEERRLFYVGLSRAEEELLLTHTGRPTWFITNDMSKMINPMSMFSSQNKIQSKKNGSKQGKNLYPALREWRAETAKDLGIPAYMILHDRALLEIEQNRPSSKEELKYINGLGSTKINRYGEELLEIINSA